MSVIIFHKKKIEKMMNGLDKPPDGKSAKITKEFTHILKMEIRFCFLKI